MSKTKHIAQTWVQYAQSNSYRPRTQKYDNAHHAFLNGVHAVLGVDTPPIFTIYMMCGRDIADLLEEVPA